MSLVIQTVLITATLPITLVGHSLSNFEKSAHWLLWQRISRNQYAHGTVTISLHNLLHICSTNNGNTHVGAHLEVLYLLFAHSLLHLTNMQDIFSPFIFGFKIVTASPNMFLVYPDGVTCIDYKFSHQDVAHLATRLCHIALDCPISIIS